VSGYLLDTGVLNGLLHARPWVVEVVTPRLPTSDAYTSVLCYGEVVEYLQAKAPPEYTLCEAQLRELLRDIHPLPFTYAVLRRYATLRRAMRSPQGVGLIGDMDTLIAATALERNLAVVTIDGDFSRVPDLTVMLLRRR
jgi:predicted nucleic acid-binding protein